MKCTTAATSSPLFHVIWRVEVVLQPRPNDDVQSASPSSSIVALTLYNMRPSSLWSFSAILAMMCGFFPFWLASTSTPRHALPHFDSLMEKQYSHTSRDSKRSDDVGSRSSMLSACHVFHVVFSLQIDEKAVNRGEHMYGRQKQLFLTFNELDYVRQLRDIGINLTFVAESQQAAACAFVLHVDLQEREQEDFECPAVGELHETSSGFRVSLLNSQFNEVTLDVLVQKACRVYFGFPEGSSDSFALRLWQRQLLKARHLLLRLAEQTAQEENMAVPKRVADQAALSIQLLKESQDSINISIQKALKLSSSALAAAEIAFYHPAIYDLNLFPQDQKYAIYAPFFIPTLVSLAGLFKRLVQARKS